jgi:glycogen phosphorylase
LKQINDRYELDNSPEALKKAILENLYFMFGRRADLADTNDWYLAVSKTVRDRLMNNWIAALENFKQTNFKVVGYLSAEFLMGPHLGNAMLNLGLTSEVRDALRLLNLDIEHIIHQEEEPGLGNGGLGRLAACYMDSLTALNVPAIGYGIRYEFGIFDQVIRNGEQVEITDNWLRNGNPWEIRQIDLTCKVKFGGRTESHTDEDGVYQVRWIPAFEVKGIAFDSPIPGYRNNAVNLLRLWKSEAVEPFDFRSFNEGNYSAAVNDKTLAETITKVLYPNDEPEIGKKLRLMQQYFFVSCSLQDVIRIQKVKGFPLEKLHESFALQMNDTHPSIAVAELMRLLLDEHAFAWDDAWKIVCAVLSYTNHTLLPEALEKWPIDLFRELLPRHLEIIFEINHHFLEEVRNKFPCDDGLLSRVSIINEAGQRSIRMANLASIGSHAINGVSALHTDLLRQDVLKDFDRIMPEKFVNITNGVTPRRWVQLYDPELADLITEYIGDGWITNMDTELVKLAKYADDATFLQKWQKVKLGNKKKLADQLLIHTGVIVHPESLFDIQVKRIHEYKRQHLNLLHVITLFNRLKKDPSLDIVPRTFIFGGKAAPGYFMAKLIIRLVNAVAEKINKDLDVAGKLKLVFYPDYNVKKSEWVYRGADLSEQISTAGKEASGTGNMKFSMNGALTIGTLDGANVEIREAVGAENFFLFGLTAGEVNGLKARGYNPYDYYQNNIELKEAIDLVATGYFSGGDASVFRPLVDSLMYHDPYLVLADYGAYLECQQLVAEMFRDQGKWANMSVLNVARMGYFSSDRSIRDYCRKVWGISDIK